MKRNRLLSLLLVMAISVSQLILVEQAKAQDNVLLKKPVVASHVEASADRSPTRVNDGDPGTTWRADNIEDPWIYIDMEEVYRITSITVDFRSVDTFTDGFEASISLSDDGETWKTPIWEYSTTARPAYQFPTVSFDNANQNAVLEDFIGRYLRLVLIGKAGTVRGHEISATGVQPPTITLPANTPTTINNGQPRNINYTVNTSEAGSLKSTFLYYTIASLSDNPSREAYTKVTPTSTNQKDWTAEIPAMADSDIGKYVKYYIDAEDKYYSSDFPAIEDSPNYKTLRIIQRVDDIKITDAQGVVAQEPFIIGKGNTATLKTTASPGNAEDKSVTFSIVQNNGNIISLNQVEQTAVIEGLRGGTATIRATSNNNKSVTCDLDIKVHAPFVDARLDALTYDGVLFEKNTELITLANTPDTEKNREKQLRVFFDPEDGNMYSKIEWSTDNVNLISIGQINSTTAKITAKDVSKSETCKVFAKIYDLNGALTLEKECSVLVETNAVSASGVGIKTDDGIISETIPFVLERGQTAMVYGDVSADGGKIPTNKSVTWEVQDNSSNVIVIDKTTGEITAKGAGQKNIVVTTDDGKKQATATIIVKNMKVIGETYEPVVLQTGYFEGDGIGQYPVGAKATLSAVMDTNKAPIFGNPTQSAFNLIVDARYIFKGSLRLEGNVMTPTIMNPAVYISQLAFEASLLYSNYTEGTAVGTYRAGAKDALEKVINEMVPQDATLEEITAYRDKLLTAMATFEKQENLNVNSADPITAQFSRARNMYSPDSRIMEGYDSFIVSGISVLNEDNTENTHCIMTQKDGILGHYIVGPSGTLTTPYFTITAPAGVGVTAVSNAQEGTVYFTLFGVANEPITSNMYIGVSINTGLFESEQKENPDINSTMLSDVRLECYDLVELVDTNRAKDDRTILMHSQTTIEADASFTITPGYSSAQGREGSVITGRNFVKDVDYTILSEDPLNPFPDFLTINGFGLIDGKTIKFTVGHKTSSIPTMNITEDIVFYIGLKPSVMSLLISTEFAESAPDAYKVTFVAKKSGNTTGGSSILPSGGGYGGGGGGTGGSTGGSTAVQSVQTNIWANDKIEVKQSKDANGAEISLVTLKDTAGAQVGNEIVVNINEYQNIKDSILTIPVEQLNKVAASNKVLSIVYPEFVAKMSTQGITNDLKITKKVVGQEAALLGELETGSPVIDLEVSLANAPLTLTINVDKKMANEKEIAVFNYVNGSWKNIGGIADGATITCDHKGSGRFIVAAVGEKTIFDDLSEGWAKVPVNALARKGIVRGYDDNNFRPDATISRVEFAVMVVRAAGLKPGIEPIEFEDVEAGAWYERDLNAAVASQIMTGDGSRMNPNGEITREEMAAVIYRTMLVMNPEALDGVLDEEFEEAEELDEITDEASLEESELYGLGFNDSSQISEWARESIKLLSKCNIISGMDDGNFAPKEKAQRAQAAAVIYRMLSMLESI